MIDLLKSKYALFKCYLIAIFYLHIKGKWHSKQNNRLYHILLYASIHSKYYSELLDNRIITKEDAETVLSLLPTLTKDIIKEKQWAIFSNDVSRETTNWRNTGGSTGEPLKFPALASPFYCENVCQMMLYLQMGYHLGDVIVSFDGTRVDEELQKQKIFWLERTNFPYGHFHYSVLFLNETTIEFYVDSLNELKPDFIRGYPSGLLSLCRLILENNISLKFKPKAIYLTSEGFTQEDKSLISDTFKCPVYGQYGHTECSVFAIQYPNEESYYCNPLYGYTEILDENNEHVPIGEIGEIVVTGFSIHGLQFIRYRTGDLAVYGGETKCGEVILKKLVGRTVDYIYNTEGDKIFIVGFIFGGHLNFFNYIKTWQIEQNKIGTLNIKIVKGKGYDYVVESELINFFMVNKFIVNINYVDSIPKTPRGKHKFLIQNFK